MYLMRYIFTAPFDVTLAQIEAALQAVDTRFAIQVDPDDASAGDEDVPGEFGDLWFGSDVYGEIEINRRGDPLCDDDLDEFREGLEAHDDPNAAQVSALLDRATGMVALRVLQAGHDDPDRLDVLWDWLFDHHEGVLQIDMEGFYDRDKLIVSLL